LLLENIFRFEVLIIIILIISQNQKRVREADHSPPASAKVKKMWIYTSTSPYAFMA
jgi:hypothetical protein